LIVYHAFVRGKLTRVFDELGKGNHAYVLTGLAPRFEHSFAGVHALGGVRHTVQGLRAWFERLYRLFPDLHFTVKHIAVSGMPWDTTAMVEWHDKATTATGSSYDNDGIHIVRLRWGKLVSLHAYLDTAVIVDACRQMVGRGVAEAGAQPIQD
jgi:ketosteroid isomerase-like protein